MTRIRWIFLGATALAVAAVGYRLMFSGHFQFGGFPPSPVVVNEAQLYDFIDNIEAIGTAKANESIEITTSIAQTVNKVNFVEGQQVEKDDVLVEMCCDEEKALLEDAERQFQRIESLAQSSATTLARLDEHALALKLAQLRYSDTFITAPFSGVVGLRHVSEGALVAPGTIITTLDDINTIKVDFKVPEKYLGAIFSGKKIIATNVAYPTKKFIGSIYVIDSRIDPITRAICVKATIPNENKILKPGMLLHVKIVLQEEKVILLPEEAIGFQKDKKFVYIVDSENKAEQRLVQIGRRRAGSVEILSGIKMGDQVIMEGSPGLRPGQPVQIRSTKTIQESEQEFKHISQN